MSTLSIKGKVHKVSEPIKKTETFTIRYLSINTGGEYPQLIKFETKGDKVSLFDNIHTGQEVEVFFNIKGREYEGKIYNSLNAWKVVAPMTSAKMEPVKDSSLPF